MAAGVFDPLTRMGGTSPLPLPATQAWYPMGGREEERAGAARVQRRLNPRKPQASSSNVTATSALADSRTVSPSTPAIRPFEI